MKGSDKVIEILNEVLAAEILAIIQYESHHYHAEETLALKRLGEMFHEASEKEMKHMEDLSERIHFLEGLPTTKLLGKPAPVGDAKAMVEANIELEYDAIKRLNRGIKLCCDEGDNGSRALLESILKDEEDHADEFEDVRDLIDSLGKHYLATLVEKKP